MKNRYYETHDGHQFWYLNDELHREDGPAIIYSDGSQGWYINGKCHREDGPAYIHEDGTQEWWVNGKLHREDGPAIIWSDGINQWHVNGKNITPEVNQWFKEYNLTYDTMEFEDKMALKFFIRGLATD